MKHVFKRTLCSLFTAVLVYSLAVSALAADVTTSGACGDGVTWELTDSVLTISGSGKMTTSSG